jgi:hypothetical protein
MSDETQASPERFGPSWYGEQDGNGVDLSLIRENLRLTPLERIRKADAARRQTLRLLEYGRKHRAKRV